MIKICYNSPYVQNRSKRNYNMNTKEEPKIIKEDEKLGTEKLGKLIISMAIPAMAAQLINVLYNIVDRMYIGHIEGYGDLALTGVGVTFPIITLIAAFSAFAGTGGAPLAAMRLGKHDYDGAEKILGTSAALLLFFSVTLTVFFTFFKEPILYAFGASENTFQYANSYISIYLIGTIFVQLAVGLNTFITAQGNAKIAMLSVCIGAVINIILDPILIFGLGLGVRGAAIATVFSQACSAAWVVKFLTSKKSIIQLRKKYIRLKKAFVMQVAALGISPFIMTSTESLVTVTLNTGLQNYGGDLYVGSMSILLSMMQLITVPIQGISYGIQPIISYNYGAGNKERVVGLFKRFLAITLGCSLCLAGMVMIFPKTFAGIFTSNTELLELTAGVMPIYFLGIAIFGIQMACQGTFLATGQAKISLTIALLRKVILLVPLAIILPKFVGVMGIYYAEPIADIISVTVAGTAFALSFKKILQSCDKGDKIK